MLTRGLPQFQALHVDIAMSSEGKKYFLPFVTFYWGGKPFLEAPFISSFILLANKEISLLLLHLIGQGRVI